MREPSFRVVPLPRDLVRRVRETRRDASGRPVLVTNDGGRHQCRACLTLSSADEPVLLFSYSPFASEQPYAETGPVFIHERPCERGEGEDVWPSEFPRREMVLRAYSEGDAIVDAELVLARGVEETANELLARPDVAYLHARNGSYGCFMFRVERA